MPYAADFVALLLAQRGDAYIYGFEVELSDPDPDAFDCSELSQWGCARLGVTPTMPDGSWLQVQHCSGNGTVVSIDEGIATQGALLFRFSSDPFTADRPSSAHVAVSLGNGSTIEARGKEYGVGSWGADGRGWTHAALIPGLSYETPSTPPPPPGGSWPADPWPGRYLMYPPVMEGEDVLRWQAAMRSRGWSLDVDGLYGPGSATACRELQAESGLQVDGVVGPATWRVTFA